MFNLIEHPNFNSPNSRGRIHTIIAITNKNSSFLGRSVCLSTVIGSNATSPGVSGPVPTIACQLKKRKLGLKNGFNQKRNQCWILRLPKTVIGNFSIDFKQHELQTSQLPRRLHLGRWFNQRRREPFYCFIGHYCFLC